MGNQYWQTPPELFKYLNWAYGPFTIDGAASPSNALCERYYTEQANAFVQTPFNEKIFVNPPYANPLPWIHLFRQWANAGQNLVVALLPCDPSTEWWSVMTDWADHVRIMGPRRVAFIDPETGKPVKGNKGASVIAVFRPSWVEYPKPKAHMSMWSWKQDVH